MTFPTRTRVKLDREIMRRILHGGGIKYTGLGETFFRKDTEMTIDTNSTEPKPLHPLPHGKILIVGMKASNFDEQLRAHPRIIMWSSQEEHWTDKEIPTNVQAIFITRWIGHTAFGKILAEARKKRITIFNPEGTGMIAKQVEELLDMPRPMTFTSTPVEPKPMTTVQKTDTPKPGNKQGYSKLNPLMQFIDKNKTIIENARALYVKAQEMGIETTIASIAQKVSISNRKRPYMERPGALKKSVLKPSILAPARAHRHVDVVVEILDNMVKELQDMRDFLIATTEENRSLKERFDHFKKALGD